MSDLNALSLVAQMDGLATGAFSATELVQAHLDAVDRHDALNAFITVTADLALDTAAQADAARVRGEASPLAGIPIAHKDLFCTEGVLTTCGSRMLENFVAPYDAEVVRRCQAAGFSMLGKLNLDEFAMGSSNENSAFGPVRNPWDRSRVPGGSSGGSAAAVAARLTPLATATDTGGSIRQPAAFTGTCGLKPTYGRVSRWGMVAYASSLDQGGLIARSAEDLAIGLAVIAGHDAKDSTSSREVVPNYRAALNSPCQGLRIGLPSAFFDARMSDAMRQALETVKQTLTALGAELIEVELPHLTHAIPAYYVIAPAEASSNLSRFDGVRFGHRVADPQDLTDLYTRSRGEGFGSEVKRRILIGTYALSEGYYDAYYKKAQQIRRLIKQDFLQAFTQCDLLLGPTTPGTAFAIGAKQDDPVAMYLEDIYTVATNLAGLPGGSFPAGLLDGLPVGYQLMAPHFAEARILQVAHHVQQVTAWHQLQPEGL
ncbi:MAG: Asp-tRNA(Asn)/Glu-tRNA(Gln) amidotransferase subunit GatA [Gammaproteobacteria bacterium]|nr:Asp-tRNA(Asn)/Glu-tRNA(Gln) amidotransferase subunit GatA [Gammaproteobacteria bacterium]